MREAPSCGPRSLHPGGPVSPYAAGRIAPPGIEMEKNAIESEVRFGITINEATKKL